MPLALGHMSVDVDVDVLEEVEAVVVNVVVEMIIMLVGVGLVVLDAVWMLLEELPL